MQMKGRYLTFLAAFALTVAAVAQGTMPEPKFGTYTVGDDYFLANYTQLQQYWDSLAKQCDRIKIVQFGETAEGRPMKLAVITSPENMKNLDHYRDISRRLALAKGLTDEQAHALAHEGKAVVYITAAIHATETVSAQGVFEFSHEMCSRSDPETLRILNDDILIYTIGNPDGMELVSNWYMRESDPKNRNMQIPVLYQKYIGHDNNRDFYMENQPETIAVNKELYREWIPQIMYTQHQTGPPGAVLFMSPFRDPFNYNSDPMAIIGIDMVGAAVHERFLAEDKPGAVLRSGAPYSTWTDGTERSTVHFHNQIGVLTEIIGNPTPIEIPLVTTKMLPNGDQPLPIGPKQVWHQSQSIDYLSTVDRAILDLASKYREDFLYRIYKMGTHSIEFGNEDHWTMTPTRIATMDAAIKKDIPNYNPNAYRGNGDVGGGGGRLPVISGKYLDAINTPEARDPRGYILSADQPDFLTATKFVNALIKAGIEIQKATAPFTVGGKSYPAGSYVIQAAQAFRPHLRDMMEPQDYPNDLQYPGGPPKPPYDVAGYTLAFQMGVKVDRILDGFSGPFEPISDVITIPAGSVTGIKKVTGYMLSHQVNDSFTATTRLLAANESVYWLKQPFTADGKSWPIGTIYVPAKAATRATLEKVATETGVSFTAVNAKPAGDALLLHPVRIGLWDRYSGSIESGHIRWMFEKAFPTPYKLVYAPELDAGDLHSKYDVLIFPNGGIPAETGGRNRAVTAPPANLPAEYKDRVGAVTLDKTGPQLRKFVEDGGTLIAIGSSSTVGYYLGLPITDALVEKGSNGGETKLPTSKFFIPGSILQAKVDTSKTIAYGLPDTVDMYYDSNPAYHLTADAAAKNVDQVAWFDSAHPLRSGWAVGQQYLDGAASVIEAKVGKGNVYLFGTEVTFRAQPHGTFKFLFNSIYSANATATKLP